MPFDPSKLDPAMMAQASAALQRLPKGQIQRLQSIMQKAMAGKDVSREAAELEGSLPPDFRAMMQSMMGGMMAPGASSPQAPAPAETDMTADDARKIVEQAVRDGKMSAEEAEKLLAGASSAEDAPGLTQEQKGGLSKLWRSVTGKK